MSTGNSANGNEIVFDQHTINCRREGIKCPQYRRLGLDSNKPIFHNDASTQKQRHHSNYCQATSSQRIINILYLRV